MAFPTHAPPRPTSRRRRAGACVAVPLLLALAGCSSQPSRPSDPTPPPAASTLDAGALSVSAPGAAARDANGGCLSDADCGQGRVCGRCGQGPGECTGGCSSSADCPAGTTCVQVQCIRCPCPAQCMKRCSRSATVASPPLAQSLTPVSRMLLSPRCGQGAPRGHRRCLTPSTDTFNASSKAVEGASHLQRAPAEVIEGA